jgi:VanZ family protein
MIFYYTALIVKLRRGTGARKTLPVNVKSLVNDKAIDIRERRIFAILCGIAVVAMLFATLWPFNPFPPNKVSWLADADGIRFGGPGVVSSKAPLRATGTDAGNTCSLELLLRPANVDVSTTILGFSAPGNPQQFAVRQWLHSLLITRDTAVADQRLKRTKFDVDHVFQPGKLSLVSITSGPSGTVVYVNGRHAQTFSRFTILPNDLSGQIVMGASSVEYQPWPGEIGGLAIYSRDLTASEVAQHYSKWADGSGNEGMDTDGLVARYEFTERSGDEIHNSVPSGPSLEIPSYFQIPHKRMLKPFWKEFEESKSYLIDVVMNIVGFIPLGFIFAAFFELSRSRGKAVLYATLVGGSLSFLIEVLQAYIPQRVSGTTDIITNTLGTLLGAVLARPNLVRSILEKAKLIAAGSDIGSR